MRKLKVNNSKFIVLLFLFYSSFSFSQIEKADCKQFQKKIEESMEKYILSNLPDELSNLNNGTWCIYYTSNDIFLNFSVNDGKLNGRYLEYYPNNKIKLEREYKNGLIDGLAVMWGKDSNIWTIVEMENGVPLKHYLFNKEQKVEKVINHYGRKPGTKTFFRPKPIPKRYKKYLIINK